MKATYFTNNALVDVKTASVKISEDVRIKTNQLVNEIRNAIIPLGSLGITEGRIHLEVDNETLNIIKDSPVGIQLLNAIAADLEPHKVSISIDNTNGGFLWIDVELVEVAVIPYTHHFLLLGNYAEISRAYLIASHLSKEVKLTCTDAVVQAYIEYMNMFGYELEMSRSEVNLTEWNMKVTKHEGV